MKSIKILLALTLLLTLAGFCDAAPPYRPTVAVFQGVVRQRDHASGVIVQLHVPHDVHPTSIRVVHLNTGKVRVVDFNPVFVHLADHQVFTASMLQTDWPVCNIGDPVRIEALVGDTWTSYGNTKVVAR